MLQEAASGAPRAVLIATGSECTIAAEARETLETAGIPTRLVSLPCWELFDAESDSYRESVLGGPNVVRVAIEAGSTFGWERYVGQSGAVVGMSSFGASAPAPALYTHFGITAAALVDAVKSRL